MERLSASFDRLSVPVYLALPFLAVHLLFFWGTVSRPFEVDFCLGKTCPPNAVCTSVNGTCVGVCLSGFTPSDQNDCVPSAPITVTSPEDACLGKTCPANSHCAGDSLGQCVATCFDGFLASGNECVPDSCYGLTCPPGGQCKSIQGNCILSCLPGFTLNDKKCEKRPEGQL